MYRNCRTHCIDSCSESNVRNGLLRIRRALVIAILVLGALLSLTATTYNGAWLLGLLLVLSAGVLLVLQFSGTERDSQTHSVVESGVWDRSWQAGLNQTSANNDNNRSNSDA